MRAAVSPADGQAKRGRSKVTKGQDATVRAAHGPNADVSPAAQDRVVTVPFSFPENDAGELAIEFLRTLKIPEGKKSGQPLKLAEFQRQFVRGALRDVFRDAPIGSQIIPVPEGSADDMDGLRRSFRGNRGAALIVEGVAQAVAAGLNPQLGQKPDQLSPDLQKTLADKLLTEAKNEIYSVFGILPGMMNASTTGPMVREGQRHLAQLVLQPIADLLAEEATQKLGSTVTLDCVRPMQAFDHGGKARALNAMLQALAQAKEAGLDDATMQDALQFIDWQD